MAATPSDPDGARRSSGPPPTGTGWGPRAQRPRWWVPGAIVATVAVVAAVVTVAVRRSPPGTGSPGTVVPGLVNPISGTLPDGRRLTPAGVQVPLGNFPTGAALTADGRYLWTVSAGFGHNDVRIVDTDVHQVCQILDVPGASGGIALDSANRLAYVSGAPVSRWLPSQANLPGAAGNGILVFRWTDRCGQAALVRVIPVPPPPDAPAVQQFPQPKGTGSWPERLAVSPDGRRLLVALNLADHAAIVDLDQGDRVRYVPTGSYPYGAAILPDGATGLVTNEAAGTVSVIDLDAGTKRADITAGPPLSHPEGVVVDAAGAFAYVALSASDQVVVVDLAENEVEQTVSVGRREGLGTMPVALALAPDGTSLYVAESGADEIAVIRLPHGGSLDRTLVGRIPVADQPQAVAVAASGGAGPGRLVWVSAEATGNAPNPDGPDPTQADDPIFWAFNPKPPTTDIFEQGVSYWPNVVTGRAGVLALPSDAQLDELTRAAAAQLVPVNAAAPPADTPLRAGGPIKHVFFIVRENRAYDQLLGDVARGNGDPKLTVFGADVTPNLHALVDRFPLVDNVLANSEASIQGHYWTASASVPDYVVRNWLPNYAGRGRASDFGVYAVTWPGNGFLFDQAEREHISYFNYGEGFDGSYPGLPDRDRSPEQLAQVERVSAHSDLGPPVSPTSPGGCYPSSLFIGLAADNGEIFGSSLPPGAPAGSHSQVDCFRQRFAQQLADDAVPAFNYLTVTGDHTRGTQVGFPTPTAMVADNDLALGQLVDTISHSPIWSSSAIFVVEDDSQDGADHVDAHRIPVAVISPYTRRGVVVHTRYDLLSVTRSMELILGMNPLNLNDTLATPMYDVFAPTPVNAEPVDAIPAKIDLLTRNQPGAPGTWQSARLPLDKIDQVPQHVLDGIIWRSVHGERSTPPPPGPNAEHEQGDDD